MADDRCLRGHRPAQGGRRHVRSGDQQRPGVRRRPRNGRGHERRAGRARAVRQGPWRDGRGWRLMRPLALTIEGLRSFRSQVQISFEGRDNIAIIGDTGAGKSSIIEAMTYALFGRATFSGQANQEIINDLAEHMRVTLRFAVGGETYEVTRTLRRAADGSVGAAKAAMTEFGADGSEV